MSDAGEALARGSEGRASARERVVRLQDYLGLFARLDRADIEASVLEQRKDELETQLEAQRQAPSHFTERVQHLASWTASPFPAFLA